MTSETRDQKLFWELIDELRAEEPYGLVVKLPAERVQELVASGRGEPFAPAGRVFKEWISVPRRDRRQWLTLLKEGIAFVGP